MPHTHPRGLGAGCGAVPGVAPLGPPTPLWLQLLLGQGGEVPPLRPALPALLGVPAAGASPPTLRLLQLGRGDTPSVTPKPATGGPDCQGGAGLGSPEGFEVVEEGEGSGVRRRLGSLRGFGDPHPEDSVRKEAKEGHGESFRGRQRGFWGPSP